MAPTAAAAAASISNAVHDPWSALATHCSVGGPPSPDITQCGTAAARAQARASREELVLVESDDEGACSSRSSSAAVQTGAVGMAGVAGSGAAKVSAGGKGCYKHDEGMPEQEASEQLVCHGAPKAGGWGKGQLATAGTLMLGSHGAAAAGRDGVFDDDDEREASAAPVSKAVRRNSGGSLGVSATGSQVELPHAGVLPGAAAGTGGAHDELGFEDVEEDAVGGSAAGTAGIADELAAKLAQFEAMVDEDD